MRGDKLNDGKSGELECTYKIRALPELTKIWRTNQIDKLNDDELDKLSCIYEEN